MLQRAITAHHRHRQCIAYAQWLLHPTATLHSRPPPLTDPARHRPFSTSLVLLRLRDKDSEASPRLLADHASDSSSPAASSNPESPRPETHDQDDALVTDLEEGIPRAALAVEDLASRAQASNPHSRTRTRPRALRPLLIPPTFPPNLLLPTTTTTNTPISDPPSPSSSLSSTSSLHYGEEKGTAETATTTTIKVADLPPNTLKTDIRPVFQHYGDVKRIVVHQGGRSADVAFADADAVSRVLHAYAEEPLRVRGQEIVVFRKRSSFHRGSGVRVGGGARGRHRDGDHGDGEGDGAIFVSDFPAGTTQEELLEALAPLGKYEGIVMRPSSKYAYITYSSDDRVQDVLRAHERLPITVRRHPLRIERTPNRPYIPSDEPSAYMLERGKPLDPAESSAVLEELEKTVPRWRGSYEPSRVLWIGRLPYDIDRDALTNFWSRLGCVVEVRTNTYGFAHVEFASTEEAIRAAHQGAPHGFRYAHRLLDVDFAPWIFYVGPAYRVVYISGWLPSNGRSALSQWASDIHNVTSATILAPFRGAQRTDPRGAFLQFRSVDDARAALRALDGRKGPGGETLRVALSRAPAVHPNRLWRWACMREGTEEEAAYFENECDGLGFGTGEEDQLPVGGGRGDGGSVVDAGARGEKRKRRPPPQPVGMRGGRFRFLMKAREKREKDEGALHSHPLWAHVDRGEAEEEKESIGEEGERKSVPLSSFLRPTRRHQLTNMVRDSADNRRAE